MDISLWESTLRPVVPEIEMKAKLALVEEINELKQMRGASVLGHNYMEPAIFHLCCDAKGDSLELARFSQSTQENLIVFCGVVFMAETCKLLAPEKKVLIPSQKAGCSLASSITAQDVRDLKAAYPGVPVVTYINSYAEVKAESDIICTSGNAERIVESLNVDSIIFLPDAYLAENVAKATGKEVIFPQKSFADIGSRSSLKRVLIGWQGRCEVHDRFTPQDIYEARKQFPDVLVLAHPECPPEVVDAADFSGSTAKMIRMVQDNPGRKILLLTECSMADNIIAQQKEPQHDAEVLRLCNLRCPHMAQIRLEDLRDALKFEQYEVNLPPELIERARKPLLRMLAM